MTLRLEMITVDCVDPPQLAQWWAGVLGDAQILDLGGFLLLARGDGPALGFQRVDDPTPGKNRLHLDFMAPDVDAEAERLIGLGATEVDRQSVPGGFRWVVLADPEGNVFCVGATRD
jgi:predicted enzyme related to lactoylglutathione lyase